MHGLAQWVGAFRGWRRASAAFLLGALATAALPPIHAVPVLLVSFTGLVWLVEGTNGARWEAARRAFATAWWFGLGHFATGLYWISHALLVDAARFGWLIPIAVLGVSGGLAVFIGAAGAALRLSKARGVAGVLVLALAWTAGEWLRGHVLTGFPWNLIGTTWGGITPMMQPAALVGLYGLGLLTVIIAAMPSTLALPRTGAGRWAGTAAATLLLAGLWAGGALRLADAEVGTVPDIRLRLVQPDIPQSLKWDPALRQRHLLHTMELSRAPGYAQVSHVIWPEAAVPFPLSADATLRQGLGTIVPPGGLLITGSPRVAGSGSAFQVWNSLYAIDGSGVVAGVFDKFHLVPFGEYVPLRSVLPLDKVTPGMTDFTAGAGPRTLSLEGLPPLSPLICYEVIFGGHVVDAAHRPAWLLNLTNDAWFGISSGPYQHFAAARFRTVEEGLPLVRAANNGISAVVDPFGRVTASLGLGAMGVVDAELPRALDPTPYARFGDAALAALVLVVLALAAVLQRLRYRGGSY